MNRIAATTRQRTLTNIYFRAYEEMSFLIEKYGAKDLPGTGTLAPSNTIPDPEATSDGGAEATIQQCKS